MSIQELGNILSDMYNNAPKGQKAVMIHLFGVKFANEISSNGYSVSESISKIIEISGLKPSYFNEVYKGVRLSQYVVCKDNI
jgi:5-methylcytosine-specific restriction protein B